jgi:hypothetical protein
VAEQKLLERDEQLKQVQDLLAAETRPSAILISGVGRTSFLEHLKQTLHNSYFASLSGKWGRGEVAEALRDVLPAEVFALHDASRDQLALLENRVEAAQTELGLPQPGEPETEMRYRAVQAIPPGALHYLIRRIFTVALPNELSEQAAAFVKTGLEHIVMLNANNLSQLRAFVEEVQATFTPSEWELYLRPDETLARRMSQGVAALATARPLLIMVDDYPGGETDRTLGLIIEESGNTSWLLASEKAGVQIKGIGNIMLQPLSADAIKILFGQRGHNPSDDETRWLHELTGGLPLALQIAAATYNSETDRALLDAAVARMSDNRLAALFLYFVEEWSGLDANARLFLYRQAILRQPADTEFATQFEETATEAGYGLELEVGRQLVTTYPWLMENGALQPSLRRILRSYLMLERRRFSQIVQEGILEPARTVAARRLDEYERNLTDETGRKVGLAERTRDRAWGELVADVAYYQLWLDEGIGWFFTLPRAMMAAAYNEPLARYLVAVADELKQTYYVEGKEMLPLLQTLLAARYSGGRDGMDKKLKALEGLEELGTTGRGRWFRAENLGQRPENGGSPEAELRGIVRWFQAKVYEEAGQYERVNSMYEAVLVTNVRMPEMEKDAAKSALYTGMRYRLKGSKESAYSGFSRAVELDPNLPQAQRALFYQSLRTKYFNTALKAADALANLPGYELTGELFTIFALYALERQPEALTEVRRYVTRPSDEIAGSRGRFLELLAIAELDLAAENLPELLTLLPD